MPTTIRTSDPRELLALVPFQLGFQPVESAVLVSIRGDHGVGLIARVDLADLDTGGQLARALVSHLVGDGARRAVVVVYTAQDLQDAGSGGPAAAVASLRDAAGHHLGEIDCWVVGPEGYYGLGCADTTCCPPGGRPLDDLQGTRVGAQMVLEGVQVARSRDDLVRIPSASPAARKAARRARVRWEARYPVASPADAHRWRREGLELWRGEVVRVAAGPASTGQECSGDGVRPVVFGGSPPDAPPPTVIGRIQAALGDVLVRDAVLLTLVPDGDRVADEVVAGDAGADVGRALRTIIDPTEGKRPDPRRTGPARTVLEQLVAHGPRQSGPALTLLAVLAWWEGDGARAGVLVDRALLAAPGYRLAVLVDDALRLGMPPGWVRAQT